MKQALRAVLFCWNRSNLAGHAKKARLARQRLTCRSHVVHPPTKGAKRNAYLFPTNTVQKLEQFGIKRILA